MYPSTPQAAPTLGAGRPSESPATNEQPTQGAAADATAAGARSERLLGEIRDALDAQVRAARHRPANMFGLVALLAQVVAGGFLALALVDFVRSVDPGGQLLKLAFAGVFQLIVIAAALAGRSE